MGTTSQVPVEAGVAVTLATGRAEDVPAGNRWLSPLERTVEATLRWPKRRLDWRLGRWVAKRAVIACLPDEHIEPPDIEILAQETGAPAARVLAGPLPIAVSVSISHSDGVGLAAAAKGAIALGCDVERVEPRTERFVADYFTAAERERVARTAAVDRPMLVTLIWSAKEAALKVLGEGMRLDTRAVSVEVPMTPLAAWGQGAALRVRLPDARWIPGWCWVGDGFAWAVLGDCPTVVAPA
jgi:4'-phosphopantetheinyl transferase